MSREDKVRIGLSSSIIRGWMPAADLPGCEDLAGQADLVLVSDTVLE